MTPHATELINKQAYLESILDKYSAVINKARRGAMGLTLEEDKTPEWKEAKRLYDAHWKMYQDVNKALSKLRKFKGYEIINGKRVCMYKYS